MIGRRMDRWSQAGEKAKKVKEQRRGLQRPTSVPRMYT